MSRRYIVYVCGRQAAVPEDRGDIQCTFRGGGVATEASFEASLFPDRQIEERVTVVRDECGALRGALRSRRRLFNVLPVRPSPDVDPGRTQFRI